MSSPGDLRQPPQNTVQAAGQVASDIVGGLKAQPVLLTLVVLNMIAIGFAAWFLGKLADIGKQNMHALIEACFDGKHPSVPRRDE